MILPFAYLLHQHADTVLDLLESFHVTCCSGQSQPALQVVLSTWCENAETFQGYWNIRVRSVLNTLGSSLPISTRTLDLCYQSVFGCSALLPCVSFILVIDQVWNR